MGTGNEISQRLKLFCILLLCLIGGLTTYFTYQAIQLDFDYNFENYFPVDDDDPKFFYEFRNRFGSENDFVFIALENSPGIFNEKFLLKVKSLSDSLALLPEVEFVQSPVTMKSPVISEVGFFEIPFIHLEKPEEYPNDSARIFKTEWMVNTFFAHDAKALTVVVKNTGMLSKKKSDLLLNSIESLVQSYRFENYHLAGRIHAQHYFLAKMKYEIALFFIASMLLVFILLAVTFRSGWGIALPVVAVLSSIAWLFGIMNLSGKSLDLMSSLLPTIVFVVGMSDVIHIISKYLDEIGLGKSKMDAIKSTVKDIGRATLLTSFTTAIGFLSLLTSGIIPIRQFGLHTALGVCIAFILAYLILPPVLLLMKRPSPSKIPQKSWNKILHSAFLKIIKYRKAILVGSVVILIISLTGLRNVRINNFLLEDLPDDDSFKKEYLYFESRFSGARPFEMGLWLTDSTKSFYDLQILHQLEKIEGYLKTEYGTGFLVSPLALVKSAHQALHGGLLSEYRLPVSEQELTETKKVLKRISKRDESKMVISDDLRHCRISGKIPDYGGLNFKNKNKALENYFIQNTDTALLKYKVTGTAALIDKNNELLAGNMTQGLLIAFILIAVLFGIIYRSVKMVIIALIPNILPLVMIGGIMGFAGIDLKISTSIVFTIAFGIAVDDSIHFLSRMKLEMQQNKRSWLYAMKRTYLSTGKALVITTIILSGGFLTLILSGFASSFYIGLLISLTLVFALAGDMILLPALLITFYKSGENKKNK